MSAQAISVGVVGGGAWGTALAASFARAGRSVLLWARDPDVVADINARHENRRRLPGVILPAGVRASDMLAEAAACDAIVLAVPTQSVRDVASALAPVLPAGRAVVIAAKGLERTSQAFLTDVLAEALPQAVPAVLSGPSFASDVARGLPTAVTDTDH